MDIYAIVTDKIINLLEQGIVPWRRPWTGGGLPRNVVSKKPYRGINHFLLSASKYVQPYWLTMRSRAWKTSTTRRPTGRRADDSCSDIIACSCDVKSLE